MASHFPDSPLRKLLNKNGNNNNSIRDVSGGSFPEVDTNRHNKHTRSQSHNISHNYENENQMVNWTTLIPPMPNTPPSVYRRDRDDDFDFQSSNNMFDMKKNQRHSIATSSVSPPNNVTNGPEILRQTPRQSDSNPFRQSPATPKNHTKRVLNAPDPIHPSQNRSISNSLNLIHSYQNKKVTNIPEPGQISQTIPLGQISQTIPPGQISQTILPGQISQTIPPPQVSTITEKSRNISNANPDLQNNRTEVMTRNNVTKKSVRKKRKNCKRCGLEITGQFVRALHSAFHVECFCCNDCGKQCSAKFFPYDITDSSSGLTYQVALCEYDYFKKLDLICFNCNNALRGPYITALGNKYHLEHFKCAVCNKIFESDESYYEHENNIYCHYHYSKLFASNCDGCKSSIVKQFVELFKGGKNQQWHPECYMVHKFWNVYITADSVGLQSLPDFPLNTKKLEDLKSANISPELLLSVENQIEITVMTCWLTLSGYEECTAACISDMLLNACTRNQGDGLLVACKLVLYVEVLFHALDYVQDLCQKSQELIQHPDELTFAIELDYFQPLRKEPRNISGKIMSYLALLRKSNEIASSGALSAELLSVITGCAHYLKLLIRVGLNNSLKLNKLRGTTMATDKFFELIALYEEINGKHDDKTTLLDFLASKLTVPKNATDSCQACYKSIEKACAKFGNKRWHLKCFKCTSCSNNIVFDQISDSCYDKTNSSIICPKCSTGNEDSRNKFEAVTDLSQLVYLLKIAVCRSRSVMVTESYSAINRGPSVKGTSDNEEEKRNEAKNDYFKTLNDVTKLRTRRQSQKLSSSIKQNARKSVILDAPEADKAEDIAEDDVGDDSINQGAQGGRKASSSSQLSYMVSEVEHLSVRKGLTIKEEPQRGKVGANLSRTSDLLKNEKSLTLDDIPRIVAAEQAREHRPNAFKHQNTLYQNQKPMQPIQTIPAATGGRNNSLVTRSESAKKASPNVLPEPKKSVYYSELSKSEHFVLRHIAVEALLQLSDEYNKETLLSLIETKKLHTFWDKFRFGTSDQKKDKHTQVFGVDLKVITEKYGVDSDLGVGPSKLKIPIIIDDVVNELRSKDMSVEGIFRLNGNIRRLKELTEEINKLPLKSPDLSDQSTIQLAALMKKCLRELPNPLLTFNLYDLWISSQKYLDPEKCKRVLKLVYCMLPRSHRNLVEVLLCFFSWVASFADIDEDTGSKMDTHNLATVISPNILYSKSMSTEQTPLTGESYFLAIEVVNQLIEMQKELSIIPDDLMLFYQKCEIPKDKIDSITTKEIIHKLEKVSKENPLFFQSFIAEETPEKIANQEGPSNTISRGHSKVFSESHVETSNITY